MNRVACVLLSGLLALAALGCAAIGAGTRTDGETTPPGDRRTGRLSLPVEAPPSVSAQADRGPIPVHGASIYSPGQEIYRELRQEDSLMAFLVCQGEPDRVEIVSQPGEAPRILLEYRRRGLASTGTVEIAPGPAGFYAARPIDPQGRLPGAGPAPAPRSSPPAPRGAAPAPRPAPPQEAPKPEQAGIGDLEAGVAGGAEVQLPQPTAVQLDECPIEPWREDCKALCISGAGWDWCSYDPRAE